MPQETKYCHSSALATFPFQGSGVEVVDESGTLWTWGGSAYLKPVGSRKDPITGLYVLDAGSKAVLNDSGVGLGDLKLCAYTWAEVQTKHDQLVAAGGGELHFVPNATYVVPLGGKVNIDSSYVSLKFNHAKIDVSAYCPNVGTGFLGDFGVIFYIYSSALVHDYSRHQVCRTIEDGHIVGNTDIYINWSLRTSITGNVGPRAFMFDTSTTGTSNRMQFKRMRVVGAYKGLAYRSRSYFVRVMENCEISRCGSGIYSENGAADYTEKSVFDDYCIAENRIGINTVDSNVGFATFNIGTSTVNVPDHYIAFVSGVGSPRVKFSGGVLPTGLVADTLYYVLSAGLTANSFQVSATDGGAAIAFSGTSSGTTLCNVIASGQIFSFGNGSLDYNDQLMTLGNGSKVYFNKTSNWEFVYGNIAGETLPPISLTGADTGVWGRGLLIYRNKNGLSTDPFFPSFVTMDNTAQVCDLEFSVTRGWGRVGVADPDAFVTLLNNAGPKVRVLFEPQGISPSDVPSMSCYSATSGQIGQLRAGGDYIWAQLNNVTARTGAANAPASDNTDTIATTSVGGSPATVTRKSGRPMYVLQNGTPASSAKYYITFLTKEASARNAWTFFYNTQAVTGDIVIKEMVATFAATFNGTTVTWGPAPESPVYTNASGITLTGASDWKRHGWKDHATSFYPSNRANPSAAITIEIDMTAATGKLLLSHAGFDVLSLGR